MPKTSLIEQKNVSGLGSGRDTGFAKGPTPILTAVACAFCLLVAANLKPQRVVVPVASASSDSTYSASLAPSTSITETVIAPETLPRNNEVRVVSIPIELRPMQRPLDASDLDEGLLAFVGAFQEPLTPKAAEPVAEAPETVEAAEVAVAVADTPASEPPQDAIDPNPAPHSPERDAAAQEVAVAAPEPVIPVNPNAAPRHIVEKGDTLYAIARQHKVDMAKLAQLNSMSTTARLRIGETIFLPGHDGVAISVARGDTLSEICRRYRLKLTDVLDANDLDDPARIAAGQRVFLPGVSRPQVAEARSDFTWPVQGRFTSGFGWRKHPMGGGKSRFHYGIDIAATPGTRVVAARDGVVQFAGRRGALGRAVILQHPGGYTTTYGHNTSIVVRRGQKVQQGQLIATVGSTGVATGPHCHFEVRKDGKALNPMNFLTKPKN